MAFFRAVAAIVLAMLQSGCCYNPGGDIIQGGLPLKPYLRKEVQTDGGPKANEDGDFLEGAFGDRFDEGDRKIFYEAMTAFDTLAKHFNITYSLFYGSLFGQICVKDQLAWDDDGDHLVYDGWPFDEHGNLNKDIDQYLKDKYQGKFIMENDARYKGSNFKFYSVEGKEKLGRPDQHWKSPFIDISRLTCSGTTCSKPFDDTIYQYDDIFPISLGNFGSLSLPVPRHAAEVLRARYQEPPCEKAFPVYDDHFMEQTRAAPLIQQFSNGVDFNLVARRLSDSICKANVVTSLPTISLERREVLKNVGGSAILQNREICKELHSIEMDNIKHGLPTETSTLKVVFFNAERGTHWKASAPHLQDASIIMLNEVDYGMARTGNVNVARELALQLGKNYVQAVEFVELSNGLPEEISATAGQSNSKGFHCNAILSDFPLSDPRIVRLPGEDIWYKDRKGTEVRLGSRMVLVANAQVGQKSLVVAVTHLDGIKEQFDATTKAFGKDYASGPMIYAGDLHGGIDSVQDQLGTTGLNFDANRAVLSKPTYGYQAENGKVVAKGADHTHLIGTRDVVVSDMDILPPEGQNGELLSDSAFVTFRVSPPRDWRALSSAVRVMRHENR